MILDVVIDGASETIEIPDPFKLDLDAIIGRIQTVASSKGTDIAPLDIKGLIPKMIKGIAGCEGGCPANAKNLVQKGFKNFELQYVEGGILTASVTTGAGIPVSLKMFPDF